MTLDGYFREKFIEEQRYTKIGSWWDRKGENEIDLICEDEQYNRLDLFEVKRDPMRIDLNALEKKAEALLCKNPELNSRKITFSGLSLEDL